MRSCREIASCRAKFTSRAVRHLFSATLTSGRHVTHRVRRGNYTSLPYRSFPLIATRGNKRESGRENLAIRFLRKIGTCAATIRLRHRCSMQIAFKGFAYCHYEQEETNNHKSSSSRRIFFFALTLFKKIFLKENSKDFCSWHL